MAPLESSGDPLGIAPDRLFSVAGKSVLVTGGSRGIGYMIAAAFLLFDAKVVITARKADACAEAANELNALGPCVAIPADVSSPHGVASLVSGLDDLGIGVDVLVNNAGSTWGAPLEEYPSEAWDKVMSVNVRAAFDLTVALLPRLRSASSDGDPARVINIGSVEGLRVPTLENYAYPASKAALHMVTRQLALRLAGEAITVNALAPGPFDSKMMSFLLDDPDARASVASGIPLGRIGRPSDMAGAAVFLASRAGSYVTGAVIPVDGGLTAR